MERTPLRKRVLPAYTKAEERFSSVTHIVGGGFAILALLACILISAKSGSALKILCSCVYGCSMVTVYCFSSIYHGLRPGMGKKVMQVLDHCGIYFLIAGTYTPIVLCAIAPAYPGWGWGIFAAVWALSIAAAVFTAIDLKKYSVLSMLCYILAGWCIVPGLGPTLDVLGTAGFLWLLSGGISYSLGAVLYGIGKKRRWMHGIFHLFVLLGSILQFNCVVAYVL